MLFQALTRNTYLGPPELHKRARRLNRSRSAHKKRSAEIIPDPAKTSELNFSRWLDGRLDRFREEDLCENYFRLN